MPVFHYHLDKAVKMDARIDHVIFGFSLPSKQSSESSEDGC